MDRNNKIQIGELLFMAFAKLVSEIRHVSPMRGSWATAVGGNDSAGFCDSMGPPNKIGLGIMLPEMRIVTSSLLKILRSVR